MERSKALVIDGKTVRRFLFAHVIKSVDGSRHVECVQVEAFAVDHAVKRLVEHYPGVPRSAWNLLEELDSEHDLGALGRSLPLLPNVVLVGQSRRTH